MRKLIKAVCFFLSAYAIGAVLLGLVGTFEDVYAAEVAVVLGNEVSKDGICAPRTAARLDRSILLYVHGKCEKIIVSGASGKSGADEAAAMCEYLVAHGIPAHDIIVDSSGANTRKTALFTAEYMERNGYTKVIAVSQYFHLPRTRLALTQAGAGSTGDVMGRIGAASADYYEWRDIYSVLRELPGYVAYLLQVK